MVPSLKLWAIVFVMPPSLNKKKQLYEVLLPIFLSASYKGIGETVEMTCQL